MPLLIGSSTITGLPLALAMGSAPRIPRAIFSEMVTKSWDSTPSPATNPLSPGRNSVTLGPLGELMLVQASVPNKAVAIRAMGAGFMTLRLTEEYGILLNGRKACSLFFGEIERV